MNCVRICVVIFLFALTAPFTNGQPIDASTLYSKYTLQPERQKRREGLYRYTIIPALKMQPDTTNQESFQSALWTISQYMLQNDTARQIIDTLFNHYNEIESSTRRSLMEVVYGLYPAKYISKLQQLWPLETDDRTMAIMIAYLKRKGTQLINTKQAEQWITDNKERYDSSEILHLVFNSFNPQFRKGIPPQLINFFEHQKVFGCKIIYSLQRSDRNFPGLAIIQNSDGSFAKDERGRLKSFMQLARSAANLPYYITNGSTPQGCYRIKGTAVSMNNFIGPTPNIQMRMPYEIEGDSFFINTVQPIVNDSVFYKEYQNLIPQNWRTEMMESYHAGKCGRSAIIAHGTTIDPWFYRQQPFYPCTPTLGCLCAKETWNPLTGKLIQSDQLNMVNTFLSAPGTDGYLFVINIDDKKTAVTVAEVTALVKAFESKKN